MLRVYGMYKSVFSIKIKYIHIQALLSNSSDFKPTWINKKKGIICFWKLNSSWIPSVLCRAALAVKKLHEPNQLGDRGFIWLMCPHHSPSLVDVRAGTQTGKEPGGRSWYRGHGGELVQLASFNHWLRKCLTTRSYGGGIFLWNLSSLYSSWTTDPTWLAVSGLWVHRFTSDQHNVKTFQPEQEKKIVSGNIISLSWWTT